MTDLCDDILINVPHYHGRLTRASTCLNLRLLKGFCCLACIQFYEGLSTNRQKKRGTSAHKICERPWGVEWATHSYEVKRKRYYEVSDFLLRNGDANGSTNVDPDADSDADADAETRLFEAHMGCSDPWPTRLSLERRSERPQAGYCTEIKIKAVARWGNARTLA
jgi:hypothetical protein